MPEPPKRFAYYDSLSAESRRTYRKSDRDAVERACQALVDALNARESALVRELIGPS